jgi:uncharacterized lipoprotein YmbA
MKLNLKKLFAGFMMISVLLLTSCSSSHESTSEFIQWRSYLEGMQAASAQGKKAFLYFRADW